MRKRSRIRSLQEIVDEMFGGECFGVFIDDTGFSGLGNLPANIRPGRKSWLAAVVRPGQLPGLLEEIARYVAILRRLLGEDAEFHFADIHAGRRPFDRLDLRQRMSMFQTFVGLVQRFQPRFLVRTMDPEALGELRKRPGFPAQRPGHLRLDDPCQAAFGQLLIAVHDFLEGFASSDPAYVIVDEGLKKSGVGLWLSALASRVMDGTVWFASSQQMLPLQLADFAAFCFNRTQLLAGREKRSKGDVAFMKMIAPIMPFFHGVDIRFAAGARLAEEGSLLPSRLTR